MLARSFSARAWRFQLARLTLEKANLVLRPSGTFKLTMEFSEEYPNKAPTVKFKTKLFHPNGEHAPPPTPHSFPRPPLQPSAHLLTLQLKQRYTRCACSVCGREHLPGHPPKPVESHLRRCGHPDVNPGGNAAVGAGGIVDIADVYTAPHTGLARTGCGVRIRASASWHPRAAACVESVAEGTPLSQPSTWLGSAVCVESVTDRAAPGGGLSPEG